jgi:NTE family protein
LRAYAAFEGGGARGYAHVGALQASEERGIKFEGVAGTSIGAVVAALVAAGYTGSELFRLEGNRPVGLLAFDPLQKLNPTDWSAFQRLPRNYLIGGTKLRAFCEWVMGTLDSVGATRFRRRLQMFGIWVLLPILAQTHRHIASNLLHNLGITSPAEFSVWLEASLRAKLPGKDSPISFKDLKPLKVIATNVTRGNMRVFGGEKDRDRSVTEAVIASASFPLFFQPTAIEGDLYVDGGLLSNLPAWVFDEERRRLGIPIPTFGFRLIDPPIEAIEEGTSRSPPELMAYLKAMGRAAVNGARNLETRAVDDYYSFNLAPDIETLAFHEMHPRAAEVVDAGRIGVEKFFDEQIGPRDPEEMRTVLHVFSNFIQQALRPLAGAIEVVRCALLLPVDEFYLRVVYSSHPDADDRMLIRREGPGVADSMRLAQPVLINVTELSVDIRNHPLFKYEHAARPSNVEVVHASPIFGDPTAWQLTPQDRPPPFAVFTFDATTNVANIILNSEIEDRVASYAQLAGEYLRNLQLVPTGQPAARSGSRFGAWETQPNLPGIYVSARPTRTLFEDDETRRLIERVEFRKRELKHGPV